MQSRSAVKEPEAPPKKQRPPDLDGQYLTSLRSKQVFIRLIGKEDDFIEGTLLQYTTYNLYLEVKGQIWNVPKHSVLYMYEVSLPSDGVKEA